MKTLGSCFCHAVEFSIVGEIPAPWNCYCRNCTKLHGAPLATHTIINTKNFQWEKGFEHVSYIESSSKNFRNFCKKCGSQLVVINQNYPNTIVIVYTALDSQSLSTPVGELFISSKASWVHLNGSIPQYDKYPPEEIWNEYVDKWSLL